jgi:hypothetical protein
MNGTPAGIAIRERRHDFIASFLALIPAFFERCWRFALAGRSGVFAGNVFHLAGSEGLSSAPDTLFQRVQLSERRTDNVSI